MTIRFAAKTVLYSHLEKGLKLTKLTKYLFLFLALAYLLLMFSIARSTDVFLLMSTILLFCLPGVLLGQVIFGPVRLRTPQALIFGAVIGLTFSEFIVLAAAYLLDWRPFYLLIPVLFFVAVSYSVRHLYRENAVLRRLDEWGPGDYKVLWGALFLLLLFVWSPFLNFGRLTPSGYAFTWLFGFDFILRSSYSAALTLGMPPDFLHLSGNVFHYYLVSHTASALAYTLGGKRGSLPSILLLYTLVVDGLFTACLFALLHRLIKRLSALACSMFVIMAGYSYYCWYALAHWVSANSEYFQRIALSHGLTTYGDVSHLFQRLFLIEPQATTSLCLFLGIIYLLEVINYSLTRYDLAVVLGLSLGVGFGIDALLGLVAALWFGLVFVVRWFRERAVVTRELGPVLAITVICSLTYMSFFSLGMYSFSDSGQLHLEPYLWILSNAPVYFLVEFGPLLILGIWGIALRLRDPDERSSIPISLLAILVLLLTVFLRVGVLPRERLAERLLPIALLVWTGYFFDYLFAEHRSRWLKIFAFLVILLAAPTFLTDIHFTSSINNAKRTGYVRRADMQALNWIRENIPERAVVQGEPNYSVFCDSAQNRSVPAISLIPDFAERREAVGEWYVAGTLLVNTKLEESKRAHDITRMFSTQNPLELLKILSKYGIGYIYIGPCEQEMYPEILSVLQTVPLMFKPVYERDGVHIFERLQSDKNTQMGIGFEPSTTVPDTE